MLRTAMIAATAAAALLCPGSRADDPPKDTSPAARFAALKARFAQREKAFYDELAAARKLKGADYDKRIRDENDAFRADRHTMDAELRALLAAHPEDPAALDGMITLVDTMRSPLDDAHLKVIHERFLNDPRMGKLCAALANRYGSGIRKLLADVADQHPDRAVRGQANYTLGMSWRGSAEIVLNPPRDPKEVEIDLTNARKYFTRAAEEFGDAMSADGRFRIGVYARAELAGIENGPNLKVGKPAPEIKEIRCRNFISAFGGRPRRFGGGSEMMLRHRILRPRGGPSNRSDRLWNVNGEAQAARGVCRRRRQAYGRPIRPASARLRTVAGSGAATSRKA